MSDDHTSDQLNETAHVYEALHEPDKYARRNVHPHEYSYPPFQVIVSLAYELDLPHMGGNERLLKVLTIAVESRRITHAQRMQLFEDLSDKPIGVLADTDKLKTQARAREALELLRDSSEAIRHGKYLLAADYAQRAAEGVSSTGNGHPEVVSARAAMMAGIDALTNDLPDQNIDVGVAAFTAAVGRVSPGDVVVVGGETSVGKSTFVLELILSSLEGGTSVGLVSLEDDLARTSLRIMAMRAGVSVLRLKNRESAAVHAATRSAQEFAERYENRYFFSEACGYSELEICDRMTQMQRQGARTIVIDYIQSVRSSEPRQDRRNEIASIMVRLKEHARRLGVVLVVVSQLSRPKDGRRREPGKHDLKEAGELENMAEFILMLDKDEDTNEAPLKVRIVKSKDGGAGTRWAMRREGGHGRLVQCPLPPPSPFGGRGLN